MFVRHIWNWTKKFLKFHNRTEQNHKKNLINSTLIWYRFFMIILLLLLLYIFWKRCLPWRKHFRFWYVYVVEYFTDTYYNYFWRFHCDSMEILESAAFEIFQFLWLIQVRFFNEYLIWWKGVTTFSGGISFKRISP